MHFKSNYHRESPLKSFAFLLLVILSGLRRGDNLQTDMTVVQCGDGVWRQSGIMQRKDIVLDFEIIVVLQETGLMIDDWVFMGQTM